MGPREPDHVIPSPFDRRVVTIRPRQRVHLGLIGNSWHAIVELIDLVASEPRIAKHAHIPLQSGSDTILRRMHRKYRPWHYEDRVHRIRDAMPDAAIGADVMVGFPGETEAEFDETYAFIERLPFTYLHVFTYSERPGTPAAETPDQIPMQMRHQRGHTLRELATRKNLEFRCRMIGKVSPNFNILLYLVSSRI